MNIAPDMKNKSGARTAVSSCDNLSNSDDLGKPAYDEIDQDGELGWRVDVETQTDVSELNIKDGKNNINKLD